MSKRMSAAERLIDRGKRYSIREAITLLKQAPAPKFDETVNLNINLDVDPKQTDQAVRGTVILPHGTGKKVKVLVIAKGEPAREAQAAGADTVGAEELLEKIQGGWVDFDAMVVTPDLMREVGKLGKVLGPKGLMPSPKTGTVTMEVGKAVQDLKKGKVEFKMDKQGDIHLGVGKRSFSEEALEANLRTILEAIWRAKPAGAKGRYLQGVAVSSTMGPGIKLNPSEGRLE